MKLDVDFSELQLATAKMQGLDKTLTELRAQKKRFKEGLEIACDYVKTNGGTIQEKDEGIVLKLNEQIAVCFQPYEDIDLFYFES
jgi:hypothetical protein